MPDQIITCPHCNSSNIRAYYRANVGQQVDQLILTDDGLTATYSEAAVIIDEDGGGDTEFVCRDCDHAIGIEGGAINA